MKDVVDPKQIVTDTAFQVSPSLMGATIAPPGIRLAAVGVDLTIAGLISSLGVAGVASALLAIGVYRLAPRVLGADLWWHRPAALLAAILVFGLTLSSLRDSKSDAQANVEKVADSSDSNAGLMVTSTYIEAVEHRTEGAKRAEERGEEDLNPIGDAEAVAETQDAADVGVETDTDIEADAVQEAQDALAASVADALLGVDLNVDRDAVEGAVREIVESTDQLAGDPGLRQRVSRLNERVDELEDENEALREDLERPSILRWLRAAAADLGLTFGWLGVYCTVFTAWWNGYTPGKKIFRIRACRLDGRRIGLWTSFERFGGYAAGLATGLLGFAQILWDANRQGIHDKIVGTVVVRMATPERPRYGIS